MPASAMRRPFQGLIDNGPACHLAEQARRIRGEAMGREGPGMMPVGRQGFGWPRDHPKEPRPLAEHDDRRRIDRVHYADFPNKSPWPYSSTALGAKRAAIQRLTEMPASPFVRSPFLAIFPSVFRFERRARQVDRSRNGASGASNTP